MYRKIEKCNTKVLLRLLEKIYQGIRSMIDDYRYLYSDKEIKLLITALSDVKEAMRNVTNNLIDNKQLSYIFQYEDTLKEYCFRTWMNEYENGNQYVSWFKYDKLGDMPKVLSTTFGDTSSFCFSSCGISYDISIKGFLGACSRDAATMLENNNKHSIYTIGYDNDGNVINSYNLATPLMTPKLVCDNSDNDYISKHNEIVLDSRYVKPVVVIYTDNSEIDFASMVSKKLNIPMEYKKTSHTR